jgi:predicted amidophosphoribosyltransferase
MLADILSPLKCAACGSDAGADLCRTCALRIPLLVPPLCDRCGIPVESPRESCRGCGSLRGFARVRSLVAFGGPSRRLALALKRRGRRSLACSMGRLLAELAVSAGMDPGVVTFVPAGSRARAKGFDHAQMLARATASELGVGCRGVLRRTGSRPRQSDVPAERRRTNVAGAFESRGVSGRVLLVDDVVTTGATAEACSLALLDAGAASVDLVTWARTVRIMNP